MDMTARILSQTSDMSPALHSHNNVEVQSHKFTRDSATMVIAAQHHNHGLWDTEFLAV